MHISPLRNEPKPFVRTSILAIPNADRTIFVPRERSMPLWEASSGRLAFIDRDRTDPGFWVASRPEPSNCYHLYIITKDCYLELSYNGEIRHKGSCARATVILSHPDDEVLFSGIGPARFLQIRFSADSLAAQIGNAGFHKSDDVEFYTQNFSVDVGLGTLASNHEFAHDAKAPLESPYLSALRQAMLNRIATLCSRNVLNRKNHSEMLVPARARRVIEYIETNLKQQLTLAHLAAVAGASRAHFARAFRNSIGMSPHQFVRHRRLATAMRLIQSQKLTLAEIAHCCGFADQAHLTRTFKLQYGNIPTFFRKRQLDMSPISSGPVSISNTLLGSARRLYEPGLRFQGSQPRLGGSP